MEVENQIEFTDVAKVSIQHFDEVVNEFQREEFVVGLVDTEDKVQAGVSMYVKMASGEKAT